MKVLTAKEANTLSKDNKRIKIETEFKDIIEFINKAVERGDFSIEIQDIFPENISKLQQLGYKVEFKSNILTDSQKISWE